MLAFNAQSRLPARLSGSLGEWLRNAASAGEWAPLHSEKGAPRYAIGSAGTLTLEPGGQIEFSTRAVNSIDELTEVTERVASDIVASASAHGIELIASGIDPFNTIDAVPLQLEAPRYKSMDAFFRAVSPAGLRMMRQTAALQVSIDAALDSPDDPYRTWRILNRATPVLTALFANSSRYAGTETGNASHRAQSWIELDPTRTGLFTKHDAVGEYRSFAMKARVIADAPRYRAFEDIPDASTEAWKDHLSTLFPEVRPRKYYEIRCIDSIPLKYVSVAFATVAALAWNAETMEEADRILPSANREVWQRSAHLGLRDDELQECARVITDHVKQAFPRYAQIIDEWLAYSRRDVRRSSTTSSATIM